MCLRLSCNKESRVLCGLSPERSVISQLKFHLKVKHLIRPTAVVMPSPCVNSLFPVLMVKIIERTHDNPSQSTKHRRNVRTKGSFPMHNCPSTVCFEVNDNESFLSEYAESPQNNCFTFQKWQVGIFLGVGSCVANIWESLKLRVM